MWWTERKVERGEMKAFAKAWELTRVGKESLDMQGLRTDKSGT